MMRVIKLLALCPALLLGALSPVDKMNLVPSCYAAIKIDMAAPPPSRAIFVLIDQTTAVPPGLAQTLHREAAANATGGTRFLIGTFSATQGAQYTQIGGAGTLEGAPPENRRNGLSVPALAQSDRCLAQQQEFGVSRFGRAIDGAFRVNHASFDHSEIMRGLKELSARVAATPARERIVLIYSDMIEHSDTTSFYQNHNLRSIDPVDEMRKAGAQGLFGNFAGARIYVIGGGLSGDGQNRASQARDDLKRFWTNWFAKSHARLVEFGAPDLMNPAR